MKVRNGFVSNSSSSSFIMLIPETFNVDEFDFSDYKSDLSYTDEDSVKKTFKTLQEEKSLWLEDCNGDAYCALTNIFSDFVITSIEGGPDDGSIELLSTRDIAKIQKILDFDKK